MRIAYQVSATAYMDDGRPVRDAFGTHVCGYGATVDAANRALAAALRAYVEGVTHADEARALADELEGATS